MVHLYLPPELLHLVFSALEVDKHCLVSCALVCKSWREIVRVHLFARLGAIHVSTFGDFDAFLGANPMIARCVKYLKLEGNTFPYARNVLGSVIKRDTLAGILSKLPALKHLSLKCLRYRAHSLTDGQKAEFAPLRLQRLDIDRWYELTDMHALSAFHALLSLFILDTLQVKNVRLRNEQVAPGAGTIPIRKLVLRDSGTGSPPWSLDLLARVLKPGSLKMMSAHCTQSAERMECMRAFLREAARNVKELELGLPPPAGNQLGNTHEAPRPDWRSLGDAVATLDELEVLSITGARPESCVVLLSPLRNKRLERVVLDLGHTEIFRFGDPVGHWSAIDEQLTRKRFPRLESVTLAFAFPYGERSAISAAAARALPMLHAAGLLKIEEMELPLV